MREQAVQLRRPWETCPDGTVAYIQSLSIMLSHISLVASGTSQKQQTNRPLSTKDGNGMYPSGIAGTFSSPLRIIHPVSVPVNCLGYRFLPIPVPVGYRSGNRYPTGTAYPINKDTWGRSFAIRDVSSLPGYKCRSLGDAEEKERGCEEDEQRWQRDRTEEARGTSAREAGVLVLLVEMVRKN